MVPSLPVQPNTRWTRKRRPRWSSHQQQQQQQHPHHHRHHHRCHHQPPKQSKLTPASSAKMQPTKVEAKVPKSTVAADRHHGPSRHLLSPSSPVDRSRFRRHRRSRHRRRRQRASRTTLVAFSYARTAFEVRRTLNRVINSSSSRSRRRQQLQIRLSFVAVTNRRRSIGPPLQWAAAASTEVRHPRLWAEVVAVAAVVVVVITLVTTITTDRRCPRRR